MGKTQLFFKFLAYYVSAQTKHDIHSPFVFDLLTNVIQNKKYFPDYSSIEAIRQQLLRSERQINVTDLGAGSKEGQKRKVKDIARKSLKSPKYVQLLYRLTDYFKPKTMLELGTSLGISALYQSAGNPEARLITIEGCPEIASIAKENIEKQKKKLKYR